MDCAAGSTTADVDPIIEPPAWVVDPAFENTGAKTGKQGFPYFWPAVAVPVGEVQNVGRTQHDDTFPRGQDTVARWQVIGPDGGLVHDSIPVRVGQQLDDAKLTPGSFFGDFSPA